MFSATAPRALSRAIEITHKTGVGIVGCTRLDAIGCVKSAYGIVVVGVRIRTTTPLIFLRR
jgi:LDH2 family malate/lactate/ureidoglycolate dehydrogenase